ncbi:MAG: AAA family ATPase [Proteobacteria bacterium]|nr:AAA family ATPase [Pseudomonadota bacterium]
MTCDNLLIGNVAKIRYASKVADCLSRRQTTLKELRNGSYYCIDKTHLIHNLLKSGSRYYFLSHHRRFGKPSGEHTPALICRLIINSNEDSSTQYPVIRMSFGGGKPVHLMILVLDEENWVSWTTSMS